MILLSLTVLAETLVHPVDHNQLHETTARPGLNGVIYASRVVYQDAFPVRFLKSEREKAKGSRLTD